MKVAIAIDSFKGSLSTFEAGRAIEEGIKKVYSDAKVKIIPMADGGDGTVDAADLALLKKVIAKLTPIDDESVVNPDVDGEGSTPDAADLALLKKIIAKLV